MGRGRAVIGHVVCHLGTEGAPFLTGLYSRLQSARSSECNCSGFFRMSKTHFFCSHCWRRLDLFFRNITPRKINLRQTPGMKKICLNTNRLATFNKQIKTVCSNGNSAAVITARSSNGHPRVMDLNTNPDLQQIL